jgi:hypothetical protein
MMATIKYNGMELEEVTEPQIFDPPKRCVVWDDDSLSPSESYIIAIFPESAKLKCNVMDLYLYRYRHCALLPDPPKPRRATNRELSRWLAQGNGEVWHGWHSIMSTYFDYDMRKADLLVEDDGDLKIKVRKWDDTEWHEPTVEYMGLEDV